MNWVSTQVASSPPLEDTFPPELRLWKIDFSALQMQQPIGEGSFGRVYAAKFHGAEVAVKVLLDPESGRDVLSSSTMMGMSQPIMSKLSKVGERGEGKDALVPAGPLGWRLQRRRGLGWRQSLAVSLAWRSVLYLIASSAVRAHCLAAGGGPHGQDRPSQHRQGRFS